MAQARAPIDALLQPRKATGSWTLTAIGAAVLFAAAGIYEWRVATRTTLISPSTWEQLTRLDAVTQRALSPDGRMLAFVRGPSTFVSPGQIYIKQLPDGEPVQLTHDDLPKMGPAFAPDGTRVAYTVNDGSLPPAPSGNGGG